MELIIALVAAWGLAQSIKILVSSVRARSFEWNVIFFAGGMPSVHSTLVSALVTGLYYETGLGPLTIAAAVFAALIVYDAMTLRRRVAEHAAVLRWLHGHLNVRVAKELERKGGIGHVPREVLVGVLIGVVVPIIVYA